MDLVLPATNARSLDCARDDKDCRYSQASYCPPRALLHEAAGIFSGGAAYGQAIDFNRRDADAYWDGLAVFAAGADAFVEFQIVADHRDSRQNVGAVADQRRAFDGRGDLAVFDHVGFAGGEDEFAVGDVDLASAEVDGVDAVLDGANDVFGIVLSGEHVGVGHARHGDVLVAFAASVAGVGHAHEPSGELVAQIAFEDSVLDQDGLLRGLAFVIDVERAAAPGHGAVIDDRASFAGYALADQSGEGGSFLAVEVGFEAVTDGFVQKDSGPSGAEDNFHVSGGSFAGVELQNRLARGFFREEFRILVAEEEVEGHAASAAGSSAGGVAFGLRDAGDVHASQRLRVFGKRSVGADDENVAEFVGVAGADFLNARIVGARGLVGAHDEFDLGGDFGVDRRQRYGIQAARGGLLKSGDGRFCGGAGDQGRGAGGVQNAVGGKIVGVGVAGALSGDDADAAAGGDSLARPTFTIDSSTISEVEERYSK